MLSLSIFVTTLQFLRPGRKVPWRRLKYLHATMEFIRDDKSTPLAQAMSQFTSGSFETGVVQGTELSPKFEAEIPYKGKVLRGDALKIQVDKWVRSGVIETSCGQAISQVADMPTQYGSNWFQTISLSLEADQSMLKISVSQGVRQDCVF